jgi:hypothetical protein
MVKWPTIIAIVLVLLAGIQVYRVNRPRPAAVEEVPPVLQTAGTIVDDVITLPAGEFVPYRMNFTHRVRVVGQFKAVNMENQFMTLLMTEDDFEDWKQGREFKTVARTKTVPGGKMDHALSAGTYYLVFDNRSSGKDFQIAATFSVK